MTPPPSPEQPLPQRLLALVQTLQFGWFLGHLIYLLCTLRYMISWATFRSLSTWGFVSYRLAFSAAALTYGIVVYKAYRARVRAGLRQAISPVVLATDENAQYLAMALVWLFLRQVPTALLPFAVYSIFHVASYTRFNLIPVVQPPPKMRTPSGTSPNGGAQARPASAAAEWLGKFVKEYYDRSMGIVAVLEILTWFRVVFSFLTFSRGGIFMMIAYTAFLRARYAQSTFLQSKVHSIAARIDATVNSQSTPPPVRQAWMTIKNVIRQATDATDLSPYFSQGGPRVKKAQ